MRDKITIKEPFWVKHFLEREQEFYEEDLCSGGNPEEWWHYEKEPVPETWEELVDLCKKLNSDRIYICERNENIQIGGSLMFTKEHTVEIDMDTIIHEYLPYSEMYPMIKSLAGVYECKSK